MFTILQFRLRTRLRHPHLRNDETPESPALFSLETYTSTCTHIRFPASHFFPLDKTSDVCVGLIVTEREKQNTSQIHLWTRKMFVIKHTATSSCVSVVLYPYTKPCSLALRKYNIPVRIRTVFRLPAFRRLTLIET